MFRQFDCDVRGRGAADVDRRDGEVSTLPSLSDADVDAIEARAVYVSPNVQRDIETLCAEVRRLRAALAVMCSEGDSEIPESRP